MAAAAGGFASVTGRPILSARGMVLGLLLTSMASSETSTTLATETSATPQASAATTAPSSPSTETSATSSTRSFTFTCNGDPQGPAAIGDRITFCVFVGSNPPSKMVFRAKVDESSQFLLHGSQQAVTGASPVYTWVTPVTAKEALPLDCSNSSEVSRRGAEATCPQIYAGSGMRAEYLNLVISLQYGVITNLAWDNSCIGCGPSYCLTSAKSLNTTSWEESFEKFSDGACGIALSSCSASSVTCDLKVFVSWVGTDGDGRALRSGSLRLSRLGGSTLASLYDKMKTNYHSAVSR